MMNKRGNSLIISGHAAMEVCGKGPPKAARHARATTRKTTFSKGKEGNSVRTRIFALLLALVMVFSMALSVSAAETSPALVLEVGNGKGTVTVDIYLQDGAGITNGKFTFNYDAGVLTLAKTQASDACAMTSLNTETPGTVSMTWVGSDLTAEKTLLLSLQLEVAEGTVQTLRYSVASDGIFTDTEAVEVAGDSEDVSFDAPVSTAALEAAINAAEDLDGSAYTEESYAALKDALANALAVLSNAEATQEEVNAATKAIYAAMDGLKLKGADTQKLEAAIAAAKALDKALYTESSFQAVADALEKAQTVLHDENATQDQVDAATKALNDAISALKKVDGSAPTGDNSRIGLWIALLALSLAALIALMVALIRSGKGEQVCKCLSIVLVVSMLLTMAPITGTAIVTGDGEGSKSEDKGILENLKDLFDGENLIVEGEDKSFIGTVKQVFDKVFDLKIDQNMSTSANLYAPDQIVRILVELEGKCLMEQGYTQNQISANGAQVSADNAKLETVQDYVAKQIEKLAADAGLGSTSVKYNYTAALNGMAMSVPYGILSQIAQLDGVKRAYVCSEYNAPESTGSENISPNMYATGDTFGTVQTWETMGYTGKGMTVAVLDTGLDIDHPSFTGAPEGARLTFEDIEAVLTELNAYYLFTETSAIPLEADDLYYNAKVPFGFNYVDCGLDITHDYDAQGDHGSHVAGTVAANRLDTTPVVGVAPDAQIIVMKLFGQNGGAFTDDILAAIEDCILMDIDVINMSLGAPAGFTEDSVLVQEVFGRILEDDVLLAIAAGNIPSTALGNALGTDMNYTSDPDTGIVNSPSTYLGSTSVASMENTHVMMNYFNLGDTKIPFVDVNYTLFDLEGTHEYVVVPGYGRVEDYEGLDLNGKIAVVSRGGGDDVTFMVKQENAYNAGAIGLIVYNNVEGNYISMYDGGFLPNIFISKADGAKMLEAAVNGVGTIEVLPVSAQTGIPSMNALQMSSFSAWGVTADLQLMPDVTAPGGNIYSCTNDGTYGTMSGTSMACPHIAGMGALVLQHLHKVYPNLTDAEYHTIVESLVMCTAEPIYDPNGILYSPRTQGAGSANVYSAVTSPVYLTSLQKATGELTPKASLGDDPERTGVFTFSFDMNNLTGTAQSYLLAGLLMTDQVEVIDGKEYMSETGKMLTGDVAFEVLDSALYVQYDFTGDGRTDMEDVQFMLDAFNGLKHTDADLDVNADGAANTMDAQKLYRMLLDGFEAQTQVCVPANGSVTVNVTIRLSEEDKAYMDAHYENGIYAEGFIRAYAVAEDGVDLSLPFLGFYGGWDEAPVFDTGWYYEDEETVEYNRYLHVIFGTLGGGSNYGGLGLNPYLAEDPYTTEHNVLSPNGDFYYDYVPEIYVSMMRSAEILDFTWTDDATGEELFYEYYAYARKSYYWAAYGMAMPIVYGDGGLQPYTFYDENGELMVHDLQKLTLTIRAYLDDGELDNVEVNENGVPVPDHAWADDVMEVPVVIDLKAPTMNLDSLHYYTENGRNYVTFEIEDNYDVAAVVTTTAGGGAYDYIHVNTKEEGVDGEKATIVVDITDYDSTFQVVLCDYGCNETYYELSNVGNEGLAEDQFYAFRRYSSPVYDGNMYATDALNGWYSFHNADDMLMHTSQEQTDEPTVFAAEYVDGYIFGAQAGQYGYNTMFVMKAGSWDRIPFGSDRAMNKTVYEWPGRTDYTYFPLQMIALDMAYDYTSDTMYVLANALEYETYFPDGETNILLKLDLATGDVSILGKIFAENDDPFLALTLACDNDGVLYTVNYEDGKLYTIGKTPTETTPTAGFGTYIATCVSTEDTQYWPAAYTQSMTVDHATNQLYWAGYQGTVGTSYFLEVDKETGSLLSVTNTADNAEMVGLFKPWNSGKDIVPQAELTGISMRKSAMYLTVGQNGTVAVMPQPYNAELGKVVYTSADASIATVNEYGLVVGTGTGATVITATCGDLTATCLVSVSDVSGTLFGFSDEYWLLLDAGHPDQANQVADAMVLDGTISAAAFRDGWLYVAAVVESFDQDYNSVYTTNLYKLNASNLQGELIGSYDGKTTALAFNYADGFLYGLLCETTYDENWNQTVRYNLIRVNMSTTQTLVVANLDALYPYSDLLYKYQVCSGALAIDYEGNFYVNGDSSDGSYNLVRFNLDENDQIANVTEFLGFSAYNDSGDAMVWSERNGGLLHVSGNMLQWVDVSDMEHVNTIPLGEIRGAGNTVLALTIPITNEPEVEGSIPSSITLEESYEVPQGESMKVIPTLNPWNAEGSFQFTIADETIAKVDEHGVVTGLSIGQTALTVTELGSGLSTTTVINVVKNPGYLYGYLQALISQQLPLESWAKLPISNVSNFSWMHDNVYDLTIYAAAYYDGLVYAVGQHNLGGYYAITINPSNFTYKLLYEVDVMVRALAFDYTTGTMYALAYDDMTQSGLYQMNLDTMEMTLIGDNDLGITLASMAIDDEGQIYVADDHGNLYTMDKHTAALTATGISAEASRYLSSMVYDYNNDTIYWAIGGNIYNVDTAAGTLTSIGFTDCVVSGLFAVPFQKVAVPETVDPAGVAMRQKDTVAVGKHLPIEAVVLPISVSTVDQALTWTSSDETIATVDANGVVTGVSTGVVTVTATDSKGNSGTIQITVTAEDRFFYGYDELSNAWVRFGMDGVILESWADAEGLSPIVSAQYIDGVLYAYDADGYFYSVDTETFQRTKLGDGIHGQVTSLEAWDKTHNEQVYFVNNIPYTMVDMAYNTITNADGTTTTTMYGVMMAYSISAWRDSFSYIVAELDMQTGEILRTIVDDELVDGMSLRPTNLIFRSGYLYTINGYITGLVTQIDPATGAVAGTVICPDYWGDFNGGRSLFEDPLTGEVYTIRDMRTMYIGMPDYNGDFATSVLCKIALGVGYVEQVATVGSNMRITGMFIK